MIVRWACRLNEVSAFVALLISLLAELLAFFRGLL